MDNLSKDKKAKMIMIISATLLILIETLLLALTGSWAIAGLFELNIYISLSMATGFGLLAIWMSYKFFQSALHAEKIK